MSFVLREVGGLCACSSYLLLSFFSLRLLRLLFLLFLPLFRDP